MKKSIFVFFLLISNYSFAQFGLIDKGTIKEVAEKRLLVELKQSNKEELSKLAPDRKESYSKFIESYNKAVQEVLPKRWTLTKGGIEFKTSEEINKLSNDQLKGYVFYHSGWLIKSNQTQGDFLMYSFNLQHINSKGQKTHIFDLSYVPDENFSNADIVFATKVLNNHIEISNKFDDYSKSFDIEQNIKLLSQKTLLLDKQMTELSVEDTKKVYPYKLEIVEPSIIASKIENNSEDHVFTKLVWSNTRGSAFYDSFDTKSCNIVSCVGTGGLKVNVGGKTPKYSGSGGSSNFFDPDKYPYRDPFGGKTIFLITVYKSKLSIKKVHLNVMDNKSGQKMNFK